MYFTSFCTIACFFETNEIEKLRQCHEHKIYGRNFMQTFSSPRCDERSEFILVCNARIDSTKWNNKWYVTIANENIIKTFNLAIYFTQLLKEETSILSRQFRFQPNHFIEHHLYTSKVVPCTAILNY